MGRLEATDLNLTNATRTNINNIINWTNNKYGGWSDSRGTRNYDEMKSIGNFTTVENTNDGLRKLKLLTNERNGWQDATQRYSDDFYKNWMILRMEDWPKLDFHRNIIIGTPNMTFAQAKTGLLTVIKSIQDKLYLKTSRQFADFPINKPEIQLDKIMDSIQFNFQGSAAQQPSYQQAPFQTKCYNCRNYGHALYQCTEPWCNNYKHSWSSITDPYYHNMSQCPIHTTKRQSRWRATTGNLR